MKPVDLVQGTLDLLILKSLVLEPLHGWAIAGRIRQLSNEVLLVQQGSLYPALQRLEHQGWIAAKWGVPYGHVAAILHKARRTERTRRAIGLELPQKADYDRLVRAGVHTRLARLIALRNQS